MSRLPSEMPGFELHPQLAADTFVVTRWPLCRVLLLNDAAYPWLVLVPERPGLRDFHELAGEDAAAAMQEITRASTVLVDLFAPDKINVAALGNMVPQLHIHVIARFTDDAAWPKPVWGAARAQPYDEMQREERLAALRTAFG